MSQMPRRLTEASYPNDIEPGLRLRSGDYGDGTVVADLGHGIQVYWDQALIGTIDTHLMLHDRSWILNQERI